MNNLKIKINFNLIISILIILQLLIFFTNSNYKKSSFNYLPDSVEKFTTIIAGENGVDIIQADKLIKLNENKTYLLGETSLKNDEYEIKSEDVTVDNSIKKTKSNKQTITTNSQGTVTSEGFEFDQEKNIITFIGESEFNSNEN
tara:strand:- start:1342 stop:1773 length:432 start_codon:yes stop_codon:yes gene_type:complete